MTELNQKWQECQQMLADNLKPSAYQTWFAPVMPVSYENGCLVLQVKSQFIVEYIEENYIDLLSRVIFHIFGMGTRLEYRVLIDPISGAGSTIASPGTDIENLRKSQQSQTSAQADNGYHFDSQLNDTYNFATFIAGEPNKLARAAGAAVAKEPGHTAFNPLFIYGGSGVGKTHLANAIGNQVRLTNPEKRVLYVSANTFKQQFQSAVVENRIPDFLNFYQSVDVLIVDDIQYFSGIKGTQDTFFHIFNHLQQSHKQLILTSDRSPLQLKDIEDRLLTRFKWGLAAEIQSPDFQLRRDILISKMRRDGLSLSDDIVDFIANNVRESVRDLEGILASLYAYATLTDCDIDLKLTEQVVSRVVEIRPQSVQLADIIGAVSEFYNVSEKTILSSSRNREVMSARHMAMYLAKELTDHSLNEIGLYIGRRSHATVLHSIAHMNDMLSTDPVARHQFAQLKAILQR